MYKSESVILDLQYNHEQEKLQSYILNVRAKLQKQIRSLKQQLRSKNQIIAKYDREKQIRKNIRVINKNNSSDDDISDLRRRIDQKDRIIQNFEILLNNQEQKNKQLTTKIEELKNANILLEQQIEQFKKKQQNQTNLIQQVVQLINQTFQKLYELNIKNKSFDNILSSASKQLNQKIAYQNHRFFFLNRFHKIKGSEFSINSYVHIKPKNSELIYDNDLVLKKYQDPEVIFCENVYILGRNQIPTHKILYLTKQFLYLFDDKKMIKEIYKYESFEKIYRIENSNWVLIKFFSSQRRDDLLIEIFKRKHFLICLLKKTCLSQEQFVQVVQDLQNIKSENHVEINMNKNKNFIANFPNISCSMRYFLNRCAFASNVYFKNQNYYAVLIKMNSLMQQLKCIIPLLTDTIITDLGQKNSKISFEICSKKFSLTNYILSFERIELYELWKQNLKKTIQNQKKLLQQQINQQTSFIKNFLTQ